MILVVFKCCLKTKLQFRQWCRPRHDQKSTACQKGQKPAQALTPVTGGTQEYNFACLTLPPVRLAGRYPEMVRGPSPIQGISAKNRPKYAEKAVFHPLFP
jgi:hypothetical protein